MDFDSLLKDIQQYLHKAQNIKPLSNINIRDRSLNSKFQAPIKGTFYNSGGFDATGKGKVGKVHPAVDFRAPGGTSIYTIAPGVVTNVRTDPKGGNTVNVKHDNGYTSYYAHLGTIKVHQGDKVSFDSQLGTVGDSGNAKGTVTHLHMQVWHNGTLIDPGTLFSIPPYTNINPSEKSWLPGAKLIADNWDIKKHNSKNLNNKKAALLNAAEQFEKNSIKLIK
jgi:murein DD-endopeptidase MepM/ murein hydrolase activator NlpD